LRRMFDSAMAQYAVAIAPYKATRRPTLPQVSQLLQAIRMCLWFLL
jgi:hypothetical protein